MKRQRSTRVLIASTLLIGLTSGLVACGKSATITGSGGLTGISASPNPSAYESFLPTPSVGATKPKGGGGHGTKSAKPSAPPSSPPASAAPTNDYKLVVWGPCYWALGPEAGMLLVGTRFKITHTGAMAAAPAAFVLHDNKDADSATSSGEPVDTIFSAAVGGDIGSAARYPGTLVKVTGTISPASGDDDSSDNTATTGVQVPATGLPTSTTPSNIPCVA